MTEARRDRLLVASADQQNENEILYYPSHVELSNRILIFDTKDLLS
jgi:hypothetical protein